MSKRRAILPFCLPVAVCLMLGFLCGCSTPVDRRTAEHMIAVDAEGAPYLYDIEDGRRTIKAKSYTFEDQLREINKKIKASGRKKILIFVFGGMNSLNSNVHRSGELAELIMKQSDYYPIFVSWESNLFYAYYDHLMFIRRGVKTYTFGPALSPFYLVLDLSRAVARLPINLFYQAYGAFYADYSDQVSTEGVNERLKKDGINAYIGLDTSTAGSRFRQQLLYQSGFPFRLLSTPLIDACGKSAWDVMKRRSRLAFVKAYALEEHKPKNFCSAPGAMSIFMDSMKKLYESDHSYEFTLIGHSMGPLILNQLLARYNDIPYKNIVYMAAACSVGEAAAALKPYLEKYPQSRFYNLCLHPARDIRSMMCLGFLPRGSILEWIDLYLADPLNRDDLTIGDWENAIYTLPTIMRPVRSQVFIKAFGIDDPVTNTIKINMPQDHTDFSDPVLRFWNPSFWQPPDIDAVRKAQAEEADKIKHAPQVEH